MVRLTRLKIDRFRNVKPGTDLRFGPTFNVLLGKNATGKSTLLDLVAAVTNDDLSAYAKEDDGFDLTWLVEDGEHQLERRAQRTPSKLPGRSEQLLGEKEFDDDWTMVLRTALGEETRRLRVTGPHGFWESNGEMAGPFNVATSLAVRGAGERAILAVPTKYDESVERLSELLPSKGEVGRFDEAVAALDAITGSLFEFSRKGSRTTRGSFGLWLPIDLANAIRAWTSPNPLVVPFNKLGSVQETPALLGFTSAELRPRMIKQSQDGENVTTTYQGFDCLFRRADGSQISHELLSFGQKRLFSFLWYLAVRTDLPVVADELLNGLHHEWIEVCLDRLRDRQSFLATQHPFLLDHIPIESAAAVRTTFIRCTTERDPNGREQLAWRNFDEEEAERFFIAYQTGIQQVSEVLRSEGLW